MEEVEGKRRIGRTPMIETVLIAGMVDGSDVQAVDIVSC